MIRPKSAAMTIQTKDHPTASLKPTVCDFLWNTPKSSAKTARMKTMNPAQTAKDVSCMRTPFGKVLKQSLAESFLKISPKKVRPSFAFVEGPWEYPQL
jgi:hypothetical protein